MNKTVRNALFVMPLLFACGTSASGTRAAGGGYTNLSAAGQPGGIAVAMAGTLPLNTGTIVNQAGFLSMFSLRPNLLSVHGVPVEVDPDNDGDGLSDVAELTGSAFNPATSPDPNLHGGRWCLRRRESHCRHGPERSECLSENRLHHQRRRPAFHRVARARQ